MLLSYPGKAIAEPEALQHLLGPALPADLSFQLKVHSALCKVSNSADGDSICYTGPQLILL